MRRGNGDTHIVAYFRQHADVDIVTWLRVVQMMSLLGVDHFHLVGFSYGGGISYRMCHVAPHRVAKVVLMGSAILAGKEEFLEVRLGGRSRDPYLSGVSVSWF